MSPDNESVALTGSQNHIVDSANAGGALDDGVVYRLHVSGRTADDAEHLRCCRLMLQRLAQFCIALLDLLEQPYILNGDDCLGSEGLEKRDMFLREGTDLRAANRNSADRDILTQ